MGYGSIWHQPIPKSIAFHIQQSLSSSEATIMEVFMLVRVQDIGLQWKGGLDRKVAKTDKYGFVGRRLAILGYFGDTNSFFHKSHRKAIMQLLVHPIMSLIQKCIPLKWVCIDYCLGLQTLSIFISILAGISFSFWALLSDDVLLNITFCEVSNSLGLPPAGRFILHVNHA